MAASDCSVEGEPHGPYAFRELEDETNVYFVVTTYGVYKLDLAGNKELISEVKERLIPQCSNQHGKQIHYEPDFVSAISGKGFCNIKILPADEAAKLAAIQKQLVENSDISPIAEIDGQVLFNALKDPENYSIFESQGVDPTELKKNLYDLIKIQSRDQSQKN
ncbi:hypothetical protein FF38_09712 [Lucilia cuprina]|uniref:Uncharacterized protein n=1 Tax=Lucilia cuprina TaxID=7375 RepID=A0A0L0CBY3_LUCCU|nr:hypothetical protein FF38_09712 [Lucilia cuprina]